VLPTIHLLACERQSGISLGGGNGLVEDGAGNLDGTCGDADPSIDY
jgi:hypothetical protein